MQWVEDILVPAIAAFMFGEERGSVEDFDMKRIAFDRDFPHGPVNRNRIAIGFKHHLAIRGHPRLDKGTAVKSQTVAGNVKVAFSASHISPMVADWWVTRRWSSRRHKRSSSAFNSSNEETSRSGVR